MVERGGGAEEQIIAGEGIERKHEGFNLIHASHYVTEFMYLLLLADVWVGRRETGNSKRFQMVDVGQIQVGGVT